MSRASLLTKWRMLSTICAGHERLGQRTATSPSLRTTRDPHEGHVAASANAEPRLVRLRGLRTLLADDRADDLRDHFAGALDDDLVAGADVLAADVVEIVQRGALYRHTADLDRRQDGERSKHTRSPHADLDREQPCGRRCRRKLEGYRPTRVMGDAAERRLHGEVVDFDNDTVDVEVELTSALLPATALSRYGFDRRLARSFRVDPEALFAQPLQRAVVVGELEPF